MNDSEKKLFDEAKKCTTCLEWHKHCKAECCSMIFVNTHAMKLKLPGDYLVVEQTLTPDSRWYFRIHGVKCLRDKILIPKKHIYQQHENHNQLVYVRACNYLTKDYKCTGHPNKKPLICKRLTNDIAQGKIPGIKLTHKCLFRYKNLEENRDGKTEQRTDDEENPGEREETGLHKQDTAGK